MDPVSLLSGKHRFLIRVKPNSRKTEILSYDEADDVFLVAVHAPPVEGKANDAIEKYFSKLLKKKAVIKTGRAAKTKLLEII